MKANLIRLQMAIARAQSPGTFALTADMITGCIGHTATLFNNGRVLLAGGNGSVMCESFQSCEIYNPQLH
jgi:hypothetical protein